MRAGSAPSFISTVAALFALAGPAVAQQGNITGRVLDLLTSEPLDGASVQIIGADQAVLTNAQGVFRLSVAAGRYSLFIALIGHQTHRVDGITVAAGGTAQVEIRLESDALALDPIVVTATRGREMRTSVAPSAVNVTTRDAIEVQATTTPVDFVKGMEGVDVVQTGLSQSNTVVRGFNNVFSGALLVLTDNRYARVPSLRLNAYNMIPATPLDVERVEVVLGPASALYGPNSANGVMHIITTSPIDRPGTTVSVTGGNRSIFSGAFRHAWRFSERSGLKVSGQYFRGNDFEYTDPGEDPAVAERDFGSERFGGEVRYDLRPWEESDDGLTLTYGINQLASSIELTGIGAGQAIDWRYQFGQVQFRRGGLFLQAFMNTSDAGDTFLLQTAGPIVDKSTMLAAQAQYLFDVGDRVEAVAGLDFSKTTPKTEGTITGANETMDETTEVGGYVHATLALSDMVDLVGAVRVDSHEHLEEAVWSPRAGLVVRPAPGQTFRGTFNRAFSTPTTNNLFLDITAAQIPIAPAIGYRLQTVGVPETGFTWTEQCPGGVNSYCMYSPFQPGTRLPASGALFWDALVVPTALQDPTLVATLAALSITPAQFQTIVGSPVPGSAPGQLNSSLGRFNTEALSFGADPGVLDVERIRPTITTTYELGYEGLIAERLKLAASVYRSQIRDFVGPLRVESPTVFLDEASVAAYVSGRLQGAGVPQNFADQIGAGIAADAAIVPWGTVAPDQRDNSDLVMTYRNFGDVDLWGTDLGFEVLATDEVTFNGSYSYVSKECFDFNDDGDCQSAADIALNAPTVKGSIGVRFDDKESGISASGRVRMTDGFPMNSGYYVGDVDGYAVVDTNLAYRVPGYQGFIVSLTVNNLFNHKHQEFIGAPEMGIIALLKLQFAFGGN